MELTERQLAVARSISQMVKRAHAYKATRNVAHMVKRASSGGIFSQTPGNAAGYRQDIANERPYSVRPLDYPSDQHAEAPARPIVFGGTKEYGYNPRTFSNAWDLYNPAPRSFMAPPPRLTFGSSVKEMGRGLGQYAGNYARMAVGGHQGGSGILSNLTSEGLQGGMYGAGKITDTVQEGLADALHTGGKLVGKNWGHPFDVNRVTAEGGRHWGSPITAQHLGQDFSEPWRRAQPDLSEASRLTGRPMAWLTSRVTPVAKAVGHSIMDPPIR